MDSTHAKSQAKAQWRRERFDQFWIIVGLADRLERRLIKAAPGLPRRGRKELQ